MNYKKKYLKYKKKYLKSKYSGGASEDHIRRDAKDAPVRRDFRNGADQLFVAIAGK